MKRIMFVTLLVVLVVLLAGSPVLAAPAPTQGVFGDDGELLSDVVRFAGAGHYGMENGAADQAGFRMPQAVLALDDGAVLVADTRNHLIRRVQGGKVETFAGFEALPLGEDGLPEGALLDGSRDTAVFNQPHGMDVDADGNIYVADAGNHAIRKISPDGAVTTVAGDGTSGARNGANGQFHYPSDVAVTADGTIYVADTLNHAIRRVALDGTVSTLNAVSERLVEVVDGVVYRAGDYADGRIEQALFNEPSGLALDAEGNLYVSDSGNHVIRYLDLQAGTVSTVAGMKPEAEAIYAEHELYHEAGTADGMALAAGFNFPKGLALTGDGGLVIADSMNHSVRFLHDGVVTTIAGQTNRQEGALDGINGYNQLHVPVDVTVHVEGDIFIADSFNHQVRAFRLFQLPASAATHETVAIVYGNERLALEAEVEIVNERTMVPLRAVSEAFAYEVEYDRASGDTIRLTRDGVTVQLELDQPIMRTFTADHREDKQLDVAPYLSGDRTYVPLRFFSEQFELDVQWHAASRSVIIREKTYN